MSNNRAHATWSISSQIQDVAICFYGDDPETQSCGAEFLEPLVRASYNVPSATLEFYLAKLDGAVMQVPAAASKARLQFGSVNSFEQGDWSLFETKDGSFVRSRSERGKAFGYLSSAFLQAGDYVFSNLLLAPLMEMLNSRGLYGLHAAALTRDNRGYLLLGGRGKGKTTLALTLIREGFRYVADDKVLLRQQGDTITANSVTRRFNIDPQIGDHYGELRFLNDVTPLRGNVKRPFDISPLYPDSFVESCHVNFVVLLEITSDSSRIVRLTPGEAFRLFVHQTVLSTRPSIAAKQMELIARLVQCSASYLLFNGPDLFGNPRRVLQLLPS